MMRGALFTVLSIVALLAALLVFPNASTAALQVTGDGCTVLFAGQTIDAGRVCAQVVGENLVVTYETSGGWQLEEVHLWVGKDLVDLPRNKSGNPVPGRFPYKSGDITGATQWEFVIPLADLLPGGYDDAYENPLDYFCDYNLLYLAAHAALRKDLGGGTWQTETGWGEGDRIVEKGNWGTYFVIEFECPPPPPPTTTCETAYGLGDKTFLNDADDLSLDANRWGWQITVHPDENVFETPIYAGAGQNDLSKGTLVGTLRITYNGSSALVEYVMNAGFTLSETHLYVGGEYVSTTAPGQYGNLHEGLSGAAYDSFSVSISGDPIYIAAHAEVCGVFE